ncbi:hypothetical protein SPRG_19478 [Saprolegnia parasitica CBS 223.65]|uniref:Uncharacterized protein n=1 Tax=Saprolegnia parasitica (strain CBS 223.65) TaxID=695850 RepID=A0A067CS06_SAPPC|nr:hypothetical protein SPRG_19478 [Saprolegnia parasitica CBS 223.65]KDO32035.1 hypothetical protein SPRG_19478 [Saprolegnia parasitica CBS 223.65]|eukprot:XP_012197406.1 hypothetical protein SPRG_19478 [Saprolegnia parasitica CBS 223.65]
MDVVHASTPLTLTFDDGRVCTMPIFDYTQCGFCIEARYIVDGDHLMELETDDVSFGAIVRLVHRTKGGECYYLRGCALQRKLRWSTQPSAKAAFRLVSLECRRGQLHQDEPFALGSVFWPRWYIGFARTPTLRGRGTLVLRRTASSAIQLRAMHHRDKPSAYRLRAPLRIAAKSSLAVTECDADDDDDDDLFASFQIAGSAPVDHVGVAS